MQQVNWINPGSAAASDLVAAASDFTATGSSAGTPGRYPTDFAVTASTAAASLTAKSKNVFSRSIPQPDIATFHGKSSESVEDLIKEVHLSSTHIAYAYAEAKDKEGTQMHCPGKVKKFICSLPERRRATPAELIASLRSAFKDPDEEGSREVRTYGELKRRKGKTPAKYSHRAQSISEPMHDQLLAIKFRKGFRSESLKRHLSVWDAAGKTSLRSKVSFEVCA